MCKELNIALLSSRLFSSFVIALLKLEIRHLVRQQVHGMIVVRLHLVIP